MKLVTVPHPILTQKAKPVQNIDKKILTLIDQMKLILEAQTNPPGVGLAAPQVGVSLRIFIIKPTKKSPLTVFINPDLMPQTASRLAVIGVNPSVIKKMDNQPLVSSDIEQQPHHQKSNKLEGCLSLPLIWGSVERQKEICIAYTSPEGMEKKECFGGFSATIIQHELDHLEGIIFTQRVVEQNKSLYEEKNGELVKLTLE